LTTKRDRRAAVYRARSTKRGLALHTVTVDVNRVYDSKARRYAEDNRTESNIVCTGKSEAEVTSNKKLCLRYCTIEANYWQIRSIARPLCDSRTTCLFNHDDSKLQGGPKKTVLEITLQRQKFQNFV